MKLKSSIVEVIQIASMQPIRTQEKIAKMGHQCDACQRASDDKVRMRERERERERIRMLLASKNNSVFVPFTFGRAWHLYIFLLLDVGTTINGGLILLLGNVLGIQCGGNGIS